MATETKEQKEEVKKKPIIRHQNQNSCGCGCNLPVVKK